jgi:glycosyltransferase involved in cell wall biosynthesis
MRKFHNTAGATMVPTHQLAQSLSSAGFERLHVVPRGIDTELFSPSKRSQTLRESWNADSQTVVMLYVGRIAVEKNLELVLHTYKMAKRQHCNIKLVLVGDGPLRHDLEASNPDVIFAGFRTGEDLAKHYASADMFVFASQNETFGHVTFYKSWADSIDTDTTACCCYNNNNNNNNNYYYYYYLQTLLLML